MKGRMPVVFAVLAATLAFVIFSRPAQADPHAVFYTAIGQQQLFFNVLAALDQADYVEPAAGPNSRAALLEARKTAGEEAETDAVIRATDTNLSGILARAITLEGSDLWTAYRKEQTARERTRRQDLYNILRVFCENGHGIKNCDAINNPEKPAQREARLAAANLQGGFALEDAEERSDFAIANSGVDCLSFIPHGLTDANWEAYEDCVSDLQVRQDILEKDNNGIDQDTYVYSEGIAGLRENLREQVIAVNDTNNVAHAAEEKSLARKWLDNLVGIGLASQKGNPANTTTFENIILQPDAIGLTYSLGTKFAAAPSAYAQNNANPCTGTLAADQYLTCYMRDFTKLWTLPLSITSEFEGGKKKTADDIIASFDLAGTKQRANTKVVHKNPDPENPGEIRVKNTDPLAARIRQVELTQDAYVNAAIDPQRETAVEANQEGTQESVAGSSPGNQQVAGFRLFAAASRATNQPAAGQVAALQDGNLPDIESDTDFRPIYSDGALGELFKVVGLSQKQESNAYQYGL